jgi:putative membrane protein (TIGR04086 family)
VQNIPKYAYFIAFISGLLLFLLFVIIRSRTDLSDFLVIALAVVSCALLSAAFAFYWSRRRAPWQWGLWVSSSFWLFLGLVFISYMINNQYRWLPAIEALMFAGIACIGAMLGRWVSNRMARAE